MARLGEGPTDLDPDTLKWIQESQQIAWHKPASNESVSYVLAQDVDDEDGRSEWLWVRLANGDLILGVYPQADTYFATELDHSG